MPDLPRGPGKVEQEAVRIPLTQPSLTHREREALARVFESGRISSNSVEISAFEAEFARWHGSLHGVAVSSGTAALHLAFLSLDAMGPICPATWVGMPALTFAACAAMAVKSGGIPRFLDVNPFSANVDSVRAKAFFQEKASKVYLAVHLYGIPASIPDILDGTPLIEDCAEAIGATIEDRPVGRIGHVATFSLYGNKILTTGEGGMLVTSDGDLAERARRLRDHGLVPGARPYTHDRIGYNYRMTALQAAVGRAQLARLPQMLLERRLVEDAYRDGLEPVGEAGLTARFLCPENERAVTSPWLVSIVLPSQRIRDDLATHLSAGGIETRPFFVPLPDLEPYRGYVDAKERWPGARGLSGCGLSLPTFVGLDLEDVDKITRRIRSFLRGSGRGPRRRLPPKARRG